MKNMRNQQALNSITVIVDTREHEHANDHILEYLAENNIPFIRRKLEFGDYSFEVSGQSYEQKIAIERKMNLTELSGNVSQNRERFENELQRAKDACAKLVLMVEGGWWQGIIEHKYRTGLSEKSFLASLFAFQYRYDLETQFIPGKYAGMFIYNTFYYFLRNELKEQEASAV